MKKAEFLRWLERYRHTGKIRQFVEQRAWGDVELDVLKEQLVHGGKLEMKNDYRRRMAWG